MRCPYCQANKDKVIDSRSSEGGVSIRRRRECEACHKRFTTYEHVEQRPRLLVIKRDGTRVPYDRAKMLDGLEKACYKRPIAVEKLNQLIDAVEEELFRRFDREVEALEIGHTIAKNLRQLDQVAYVRFASVYKQFRDASELLDEVREVIESADDTPPGQQTLF